ncbi:MAG: YggS family pyridoxal phosphate-dependent enzyme [Bacteroidetes bacterium]|nr:YggS family pyridoxal phosphate-dependent enzyme [Bacteroidota bacterium]
MSIQENLIEIKKTIPDFVKLIAVSKTKPNEDILLAYNSGQRVFGENKAQELSEKYQELPKDIEWHFIGHLQTNKVKFIAPFVSLVHSIDSIKLMEDINKEAKKNNRIIDCLMQFHIAEEDTKFGFDFNEASRLLNSNIFASLENIRIIGVMGMATYTDNEVQIRKEFQNLKLIFDQLKSEIFKDNISFKEISMGMSDDYQIAIEEGSTMVRIGSSIFGTRNLI